MHRTLLLISGVVVVTIAHYSTAQVNTVECGSTKGCFRYPSGCSTACEYLATWQVLSDTEVRFEILASIISKYSTPWVAIGLSFDQRMWNDSVTECVHDGRNINIKMSWNEHDINIPMTNGSVGLVPGSMSASFANGVMSCVFTRLVYVEPVDVGNVVYNLNGTSYVLFIAKGNAERGWKLEHYDHPQMTDVMIDFMNSTPYVDLAGRNYTVPACLNSASTAHGFLPTVFTSMVSVFLMMTSRIYS